MPRKFRHLIAASLSLSLLLPNTAEGTPAALVAPALCSTGVGCILVGTVIIGGITYYVWTHGGSKVIANKIGEIFRTEHIEDPEEEDQGSVYSLNAKSWQAAQRECAYLMGYSKKFRVYQRKGRWYCTDKGV